MPLPLTVGDASTNYQKDRRPAEEIGKLKSFVNSRGKSVTAAPFGKLLSNAIGDDYQDAGKYFLRTNAGKHKIAGPFAPSGVGKTIRHSEFIHHKEYDGH